VNLSRIRPRYCVGVRAIIDWWDSVELWLTQLAFPMQVLLAGLVLLPLCWWVAAASDKGLDAAVAAVGRRLAARRRR
jgi:hypothetical protein